MTPRPRKLIYATHVGVCPRCRTPIRLGDTLLVQRGQSTTHNDCRGREKWNRENEKWSHA
jgi:predicted amidophosphoribosyltransferase